MRLLNAHAMLQSDLPTRAAFACNRYITLQQHYLGANRCSHQSWQLELNHPPSYLFSRSASLPRRFAGLWTPDRPRRRVSVTDLLRYECSKESWSCVSVLFVRTMGLWVRMGRHDLTLAGARRKDGSQ